MRDALEPLEARLRGVELEHRELATVVWGPDKRNGLKSGVRELNDHVENTDARLETLKAKAITKATFVSGFGFLVGVATVWEAFKEPIKALFTGHH